MAETFTGKLEWITMGGNIDVRHPDGRVVRCYSMTADHSREADRLGRNAFVTVEIPNDVPGRGKLDPRILAVSETPPPQTKTMDDIHREQLDRPRLKPASPQTNLRVQNFETPTPPGNQIRTAECDGKDAVPVTGQLPVGTASPESHVERFNPAEGSPATADQMAAVMLLHGTPEQQREALNPSPQTREVGSP